MNITFLIGNGFDMNLGLNTAYSDFIKHYKKTETPVYNLRRFRDHINENEKLWASAEIELGQFTKEFEEGEAEKFSECQIDFCEHLAEYLIDQEKRINYEFSQESILNAIANFNRITQPFPSQERDIIDNTFANHTTEIISYNFISYNYTSTLDECLRIAQHMPNAFGSHSYGDKTVKHSLGEICHVHGTVEKEMVFGVNDESQIAKLDIFNCDNGDLYKNMLIKVQSNAEYLENTDLKAKQIINKSNLIYVYGMSIGDSDALWWDRICNWLSLSSEHHLIIQKYEMPKKTVFPVKYQIFERKSKEEITKHSTLDAAKIKNIEKRIHITNANIFAEIKNIADLSSKMMVEDKKQFYPDKSLLNI